MNTLELGLIQGNLRFFGANFNMSRNTRFLCYFFSLKYSSVLYFTPFPSLNSIVNFVKATNIADKKFRGPSDWTERWHQRWLPKIHLGPTNCLSRVLDSQFCPVWKAFCLIIAFKVPLSEQDIFHPGASVKKVNKKMLFIPPVLF